jgi:hypothetical protein
MASKICSVLRRMVLGVQVSSRELDGEEDQGFEGHIMEESIITLTSVSFARKLGSRGSWQFLKTLYRMMLQ